jgi:hypothetical protein
MPKNGLKSYQAMLWASLFAQLLRSNSVQCQNCGIKQSNSYHGDAHPTGVAKLPTVEFGLHQVSSVLNFFFYKNKRNLFAIGSLVPPRILHLFHDTENVVQRIVLGSIEKAQREKARCVCPTFGPTQGIHLLLGQWPAQI